MAAVEERWYPGSFTKNFGWGDISLGLKRLHHSIRQGFDGELKDVDREKFRARVKSSKFQDYIPSNFFLFNYVSDGKSKLLADELVFQAVTLEHSKRFDQLALYTFLLSLAGNWQGARSYQERPALWAKAYVSERLADRLNWDTSRITADDIESFVKNDSRYTGQTARKLATNFAYLLSLGSISDFESSKVDTWWLDALFLTIDRVIKSRISKGLDVQETRYHEYLLKSGFYQISGKRSIAKDLAGKHFIDLYTICGALDRFDKSIVKSRAIELFPDLSYSTPNREHPSFVIHPTTPRSPKAIPRACAFLAKNIGFVPLDVDSLEEYSAADFVRQQTDKAVKALKTAKVEPNVSVEQILRLMREK